MIADSSALTAFFLREEGASRRIAEAIRLERTFTLELAIKEFLNAVWKRGSMGELNEEQIATVT